MTELEDTLRTPWQIRRRLLTNEAERKSQGDEINELKRDCRQNRERLQKAHDRIDEITDLGTVLLDLVQRVDEIGERLGKLAERVEAGDEKLVKLRDWTVSKLNGKGNGHVADAKTDGQRQVEA